MPGGALRLMKVLYSADLSCSLRWRALGDDRVVDVGVRRGMEWELLMCEHDSFVGGSVVSLNRASRCSEKESMFLGFVPN